MLRTNQHNGIISNPKDGPGDYPVTMEIMAGGYPQKDLVSKQICRITTGAAVPDGADAVIKVSRLVGVFCFYPYVVT